MSGYLNKVQLIGNLGADPDIVSTQRGGKIARFRLATSRSWKDSASGERVEQTEWHSIVIFAEGLAKLTEHYLAKGAKVYVEGELRTRKWQDQSGADRYSTEIHLTPYNGTITFLSSKRDGSRAFGGQEADAPHEPARSSTGPGSNDGYEDVPF